MTVQTLLEEAGKSGVKFALRDKQLRYKDPAGFLTPERKALLAQHQAELIALLEQAVECKSARGQECQEATTWHSSHSPDTLDADLLAGRVYVRVQCRHLDGEEIILAADDAPLPLDQAGRCEGCVVYRVSEMQHLCHSRPSTEALRTLYVIKQELGGLFVGDVSEL